jgi:serine/threonine-protein kinase RsbT
MTTTMNKETKVPINSDADIVVARQKGRELSVHLGFSPTDSTLIATAISELARNIVLYAKHGEIIVVAVQNASRHGIAVVARDNGPGIPNIEQAMQGGYSTSRSLGLGLPGVKRLMDQFEIVSILGEGTTVTVRKWRDAERSYVLPAVS